MNHRGLWRKLSRRAARARRRWRDRRSRRFLRLIEQGRHNRRVDALFGPVPLAALEGVVPVGTLALRGEDYWALVEAPGLERFRSLEAPHAKPLEYLATLTALDPQPSQVLFDAAGGASGEYLRAARHRLGDEVELLLQDAMQLDPAAAAIARPVGGTLEALALTDASVDRIACHHSFEHFRGDLDRAFLGEALRVLRPGGRLAIVPLFVGNRYGEIWNTWPRGRFDPRARRVVDPSAAFAGWGPFEGFARVYDVAAVRARLLPVLEGARATVLAVELDGAPVPDLARNRHQPRVNGAMKLLLVEKPAASAASDAAGQLRAPSEPSSQGRRVR